MADDFGDDAGDKLLDWAVRMAIEHGHRGAAAQSARASQALRDAQGRIEAQHGGGRQAPGMTAKEGWAKLDLRELACVEGWGRLKEAIDADLGSRGLVHEWFEEGPAGRQYLLFRTAEARELADAFGELADKTEGAPGRALRAIDRTRQPEDRDAGREDAGGGPADPRAEVSLREKARTARRCAEEAARGGADGRTPPREAKRERQRGQ